MDAVCNLPGGWSFLTSASAYSAFAGILGGFLFLGIITLMTERTPSPVYRRTSSRRHKASVPRGNADSRRKINRDLALMLFLPAFLSLLIASYLFGEVSGEQVCTRGYVEGIFAASLLAIGGVGVFGGIAWMLDVYGATNQNLRRTTIVFTLISFAVVVSLLADSGDDMIENAFNNKAPWYALDPIVLYGPLILLLVAVTRTWFMPKWNRISRAQLCAVYFPAAYVILVIVMYSVLTTYPPNTWPENTLNDWRSYVALGVSLFFPAVSIVVYARALPTFGPRPGGFHIIPRIWRARRR